MVYPKEFPSDELKNLREALQTPIQQDPKAAIGCILSVDPSGGGMVSAIGIVGLYVYADAVVVDGPRHYEIAHAVAISVDPKTYLFAIGDLIHAHALFVATDKQPHVFIESIDRVSYTGALFKFLYQDAPFKVEETSFFGLAAKITRFGRTHTAINNNRLRIRSDLKRFIRPASWANYTEIYNLDDKENGDWEFNFQTDPETVRLLQELIRLPDIEGPKSNKKMDDVVLALVNGLFHAFDTLFIV